MNRLAHYGLWLVQFILAAVFLVAGGMKLLLPLQDLIHNGLLWIEDSPGLLVRFIGLAELAGAVGLVAPGLTGRKPGLTAMAAGCLAVVMLLAAWLHLSRGEPSLIVGNAILGGMALLVCWGRSR